MDDERSPSAADGLVLQRSVEAARDHIRGGAAADGVVALVIYGDYLCPYCRRLRRVLARLRETMGPQLAYVFRHFPNEHAHPGAEFLSRAAVAAGAQGHFWPMHDWIYEQEPPIDHERVFAFAQSIGLDMARFRADIDSADTRARVHEDLVDGRRNGVTGTPTFFVDGIRYDGAW